MKANCPIVFIHIPKTAGTTFHSILHNKYRGAVFFPNKKQKLTDIESLSDESLNKIEVFKGHFHFGLHQKLNKPVTHITFLREPIARTISSYNHLIRKLHNEPEKAFIKENYSLKELLTNGKVEYLDNCITRYLSGLKDLKFGEIDKSAYELALKNFDTYFDHFGICEKFDESLILLKNELNWSSTFYNKVNTADKKSYISSFDKDTLDLLKQYNQYDIKLYKHALRKFETKINAYEKNFHKEVNRFKKQNLFLSPFRKIIRYIWLLVNH